MNLLREPTAGSRGLPWPWLASCAIATESDTISTIMHRSVQRPRGAMLAMIGEEVTDDTGDTCMRSLMRAE